MSLRTDMILSLTTCHQQVAVPLLQVLQAPVSDTCSSIFVCGNGWLVDRVSMLTLVNHNVGDMSFIFLIFF